MTTGVLQRSADPDAEAGIAGACFGPFAAAVIPAVSAVLGPEAFATLALGNIYAAALAVHARGHVPDAVLVADELGRTGLLEVSGGTPRLIELHSPLGPSQALAYASIILEHHRRFRVGAVLEDARLALADHDDAKLGRALHELSQVEAGPARTSRLVGAGTFALDVPAGVPAVCGQGDQILMAEGEPTLLVGPAGVGKTTLAQRFTRARAGFGDSLLGLPVTPSARRVLYVAADRPAQARRSLARMVLEEEREDLDDRIHIWKGPLPEDLTSHPSVLLNMARQSGADTVILDSLKDVAVDLSKEETGQRLHIAFQTAVAAGVEVLALHHQRKEQRGGGKPKSLSDVYGSTWITAGAGSVILLWGEPGDPVVELSHLKQPAGEVGPLTVVHDAMAGAMTVMDKPTAASILAEGRRGVSAQGLALMLFQSSERNDVEKARRQLEGLTKAGKAHKEAGQKGGSVGGESALYYPITDRVEH